MIKAFCGAPDECQEADVRKYKDLLERAGFKLVVIHTEIKYSTELEQSVERILRAEEENPDGINQPLQPNVFYSFAAMENKSVFASEHCYPVIDLLKKRRKSAKSWRIVLTTILPQEKEIKELPFEVAKDLVYIDESSGKEIGWYNAAANILWMSDVWHQQENFKNLIPSILNPLIDFQRYGRVQETLFIGADPEFEIVDKESGQFVEANRYFEGINDEIGHDGHSATGEFRPKPHRSPFGLTRNIKRLVRRLNALRCMSGMKVWAGGGVYVTTGGHIHFGMKGMPQDLKDTLYDLVAEPVLRYQSDLRTQNEEGNYRKNASGITRDQPHGIEWRPLPSFIINQDITESILCTTYAIVKSYKFYGWKRRKTEVTAESYKEIPLYKTYQTSINKFIDLFVMGNLSGQTLAKKDLFKEWHIPQINGEFTVDILCPVDWLRHFFKPVNVKIKRPVKLEIKFVGDTISTFGIKEKYLHDLFVFNGKHFMPPVVVNEKLPRGQARPLICLPAAWWNMERPSEFCTQFKTVLKSVILKLGGC